MNLEFGFTGVPNFGKVLFVASGGLLGALAMYVAALYLRFGDLHYRDIFESSPQASLDIYRHLFIPDPLAAAALGLLMVVVGGASAAALGYLSSFPAIRLREDYLGMLLLGFAELFATIAAYWTYPAGGPENLALPDVLTAFGQDEKYVILVIFAAFATLVYLYAERVARSPLGRTLKAVRDNEIASESLGKDNVNVRRKILVIASGLSGVAGALWVMYQSEQGVIIGGDAMSTFPRLLFTFYPFTIVILGGIASNFGVVLGAVALTGVYVVTTDSLPSLVSSVNIPWINQGLLNDFLNSLQYIIIGGLLLAILLLRPEGLIREKPSFALPKKKLKQIAESIVGKPAEQKDPPSP